MDEKIIKIKEENKTLKECLLQMQEANKHLVEQLDQAKKEIEDWERIADYQMEAKIKVAKERTKLKKELEIKKRECAQLNITNNEKNKILAELGYPTVTVAKRKIYTERNNNK